MGEEYCPCLATEDREEICMLPLVKGGIRTDGHCRTNPLNCPSLDALARSSKGDIIRNLFNPEYTNKAIKFYKNRVRNQ